jgi:Flp pilus assembly protein TadG
MTLSARLSLRGTALSRRTVVVLGDDECGSAVADFAMVAGLLSLLFLAVFQLGLALHIRNTLIACASEGARYGARADATPQDGVARARELIRASLSDRYADYVTADTTTTVDGILVVQLHIDAPLPVIGPLGPDHFLHVQARAFSESQ